MPGSENLIRKILVFLIFSAFFTPLIVGSSFIFPFVFPKAIFFQVLMEIGLLFYLLLLVLDRSYLPARNIVLTATALFLGVMALTTFTSADPSLSFWSKAERMDGLFQYLHLGVFLLLLVGVIRREKEWVRLFKFVIGTGWLTGIAALLSKYAFLIPSLETERRLGGTFGNPAFLSTYFLVLAFFALIFFFREKAVVPRILFGGSAVFFLWLILLSGTRGAFVGFFTGLVAFLFALVWSDFERWKKTFVVALVLLLLLFAGLYLAKNFLLQSSPAIGERIFGIWQFPKARLVSWQIGWQAFLARPLFGWGSENFMYAFNEHYNPEIHTYELALFDRAHNKIVDLLVMHGILGLLAYLTLFGVIFSKLFRVLRKRNLNSLWPAGFLGLMVGYFVQNLVLFEMPASGLLLFFLLGFLAWFFQHAEQIQSAGEEPSKIEPRRALPSWVLFPGFTVVILAFFFGIVGPSSSAQGAVSASAWLEPTLNPETALAKSRESYENARRRSTFLDREIDVLIARRLLRLQSFRPEVITHSDFQTLVEKVMTNLSEDFKAHPRDYDVLIEAGNMSAILDRSRPEFRQTTAEFWQRATELAPRREDAYQKFAVWYLENDEFEKSDEMFNKLFALNDKVGLYWWYRALYEAKAGSKEVLNEALARAKVSPATTGYNWDQEPQNLEFLGETLIRRGRNREGIGYYEMALALRDVPWPVELRIRAKTIRAYLLLFDRAKAREHAELFILHAPPERKEEAEAYIASLGL